MNTHIDKATSLREIKVIFHDWDDTAVKTWKSIFVLYQNFALLSNLRVPELAELKRLWGNPVIKILAGLWPQEDSKDLESRFVAAVPPDHAVEPFPWLEATIEQLAAANFILGVISSTPRGSVERTQAKYGLNLALYDHFQTGDDCVFHKPNPRVFDQAMAKIAAREIPENKVLYLGDSLGDFKAALARKITFVGVTTGFTSRQDFLSAGLEQDLILDNFGQLPGRLIYSNR